MPGPVLGSVFAAAVRKDVQLLVRDRGALLTMFLLPVVFIAVFGSMFQVGGERSAPREVAVWSEGELGARVVRAIDDSDGFRAVPRATPDQVRAAVASDQVRIGVVAGASTPVELVLDEAAPLQARAPLEGAVRGIVTRAVLGVGPGADAGLVVVRTPPGIDRPLQGISSFQIAVPGNSVLFGFFLAITVALSFVEERRTGTWRRVLAAPVHRGAMLLAKLAPYVAMGLLQFTFLFAFGVVVFGMQIGGSLLALVLLTTAVVLCATALGLAIAALGGTEKQVGSIGSISLLIMGLLGGTMVPRLQMPDAMARIAQAVPHSWALDGYYTLLVRDGAGVADVGAQIAVLLAFTAVFATFGIARFRFDR
jgi:ABC-2 type transport system permease protein